MDHIIETLEQLKITEQNLSGEIILSPEIENAIQIVTNAKIVIEQTEEKIKELLLKGMQEKRGLTKIQGKKISVSLVRTSRRSISDLNAMLKSPELMKFLILEYKIDTKEVNKYLKEQMKANRTAKVPNFDLPKGLTETTSQYIKLSINKNEEDKS